MCYRGKTIELWPFTAIISWLLRSTITFSSLEAAPANFCTYLFDHEPLLMRRLPPQPVGVHARHGEQASHVRLLLTVGLRRVDVVLAAEAADRAHVEHVLKRVNNEPGA